MNPIFKQIPILVLTKWSSAAITFIAIAFAGAAWAGPGHDHGDAAPAAANAAASPRFSAHSDLFEAVGVLASDELSITVDRYASNEPVLGATVEVESGSLKAKAAFHAAHGDYSLPADAFKKPGTYAIALTITTGGQTDLLAGELVMPDPEAGHDHAAAPAPWWRWLAYAAGAGALLAVAALALRRRRARAAFASILIAPPLVLAMTMSSFDAKAGPGHDHGDESAPAARGNAPKRQADGNVFLPKASQRQLVVRTVVAEEKALPKTLELTGKVVADANAGGKVQPTQVGRVEAGPRGLPQLGQTVRKGEVLAVVRAASGAIERANQQAQSAELQSNLGLARKRLARLEQLEGSVPAKDIEAARAEVTSLQQRVAAVGASVSATEALVAPVSGVIASSNVVQGQVVDAREVLFEIVDPSRLNVEASAFDAKLLANIASASASPAPGVHVALQFAGAGRVLREGAFPVLFRATAAKGALPLAVGQSVKVLVQTKEQVKGFAVPSAALVKNASNQDMVWVHTGAELFAPRAVRAVPLDGATVSVVDGLKAGDRVVTQGAPLVNQVR